MKELKKRKKNFAGSKSEVIVMAVLAFACFFCIWYLVSLNERIGKFFPNPIVVLESFCNAHWTKYHAGTYFLQSAPGNYRLFAGCPYWHSAWTRNGLLQNTARSAYAVIFYRTANSRTCLDSISHSLVWPW